MVRSKMDTCYQVSKYKKYNLYRLYRIYRVYTGYIYISLRLLFEQSSVLYDVSGSNTLSSQVT